MHKITKTVLIVFILGLSVDGIMIMEGQMINDKPTTIASLNQSLTASTLDENGTNLADPERSRKFAYRPAGSPEGGGHEFEVTDLTINHPAFKYILDYYNMAIPGHTEYYTDSKGVKHFSGYKQGRSSTSEVESLVQNYRGSDDLKYRGSRQGMILAQQRMFSSAPTVSASKVGDQKQILKSMFHVNEGKGVQRVPGTNKILSQYTDAENNLHYRLYLKGKEEKFLNTGSGSVISE